MYNVLKPRSITLQVTLAEHGSVYAIWFTCCQQFYITQLYNMQTMSVSETCRADSFVFKLMLSRHFFLKSSHTTKLCDTLKMSRQCCSVNRDACNENFVKSGNYQSSQSLYSMLSGAIATTNPASSGFSERQQLPFLLVLAISTQRRSRNYSLASLIIGIQQRNDSNGYVKLLICF